VRQVLIRLRNNTNRLIDNNTILDVTDMDVNRKWLMPLKVVVASPFTSMTNTAPLPANPAADPLETSHLISRVRETIRLKHYSLRTERSYCDWILRYLRFHGLRHPSQMGADQVTSFLSSLAIERHVAAATQNQALAALLFLYRDVLKLQPYALLGLNFGYNTDACYGWNNFQSGLKSTWKINRIVSIFGSVNYSVALTALEEIDQGNEVWASAGVTFTY